ncbi:MAG: lipid-A-disaccharide synthase [Xanthomonadales bacterium]|nr:lipid-A-disaccharide synthase [Xanthomonadales bacterium]
MISIALVAGEASGDQLGAALIRAIRQKNPETRFSGIGGPLMQAAGMDCWWDSSQLSVMGLFEVISHLPRLVKLRRQLMQRLLELKPAVFIGIDAPDFNLGVEKKLKAQNIPTIHYVSPTVWAWRPGRVKSIARATDRVMCLFPFEPSYYQQQDVAADYTGHPLADEIPYQVSVESARHSLNLESNGIYIALLPGSRLSEVEKLSTPMLDAAVILSKQNPDIGFLMPAASELISNRFKSILHNYPGVNCRVFSGRSKDVMAAADIVVCASGTATLEVMLVNRPMVVCYRLAGMTYNLAKWLKLVKIKYFSLPNILASEELVPELMQDEVNGQNISDEVSRWLDQPIQREDLGRRFELLHQQLRIDAASTAARVVLQHVGSTHGTN